MPVTGFPFNLEIMMEQLHAKGTLLSWQIFEEKSGSVCVKLRYECHDGNQSSEHCVKPISYKKKSQKQIERDSKRAEKFHQDGVKTRSKSRILPEIEIPRQDSSSYSETIDPHMPGDLYATPEQVRLDCSVDYDSPIIACTPDLDAKSDFNKTDSSQSEHNGESQSGQPGESWSSQCEQIDSPVAQICPKESSLPEKTVRCDICGTDPGMVWRRCNHMDHLNMYNICNPCYHSGHKHQHHSDFLHIHFG